MPTSMPNLNLLAPLVTKCNVGAADILRRLLADKVLHVAKVLVNAYQRTKFQRSSLISFGDMRRSQNKKWELLMSPDAP